MYVHVGGLSSLDELRITRARAGSGQAEREGAHLCTMTGVADFIRCYDKEWSIDAWAG